MKLKHLLLSTGLILGVATTANAGSYQLNDYSVTGLGRAFAGAGVVGDDYSAIAYNPAGMMAVKKSGIQGGLTLVNLKSDVRHLGTGEEAEMDLYAPLPNVFAQHNVNDRLSIGLGIYTPFGLKTRYKSNWFGSEDAILSELRIVDIAPAVAYKVTDKWSIGATFIARYIYGHMTNDLAMTTKNPETGEDVTLGGGYSDFELDGWTVSAVLGTMYEFTPNTRVGFSWRMRSTQQVKGDHTISGNQLPAAYGMNQTATGWASPALPETFTLSGYHKYKKFGFSGTARWTHWSQSFPEFTMRSNSNFFQTFLAPYGGQKTTVYNYDNAWTLTAGVDYYHNDNWTFRFGGGWDESPVRDTENRTARIPDADRWWASVGFSYMKNNWQIDMGYTHMFGKTGESHEPGATPMKYCTLRSNIYGAQLQYKF